MRDEGEVPVTPSMKGVDFSIRKSPVAQIFPD